MIIRTLKEVAALIIFTVITWCTGSFLYRLFYDAWKLRKEPEKKTVKVSKADIEYALKVCANFRSNGQKYYEHKELLECLDDLYFTNPNVEDLQRQINDDSHLMDKGE